MAGETIVDAGTGSGTDAAPPIRVVFVCTGNICRSPMAESMVRAALERAGLGERVAVSSVGTGGWHEGEPMDHRAAAELRDHGYADGHRASRLSSGDLDADLLVALDRGHAEHLRREGADPGRVRLLRSFDPDAHDPDVADPYYGDASGFARTRVEIERALPGLTDHLRGLLPSA